MVNVHAREITAELASLVKQIDGLVSHPKDKQGPNRAFFVLLTDDPDAAAQNLEELAANEGIENTPLTIFDGVAGPGGYKIAKEADVTVMIWKNGKVEANHAFGKGELNAEEVSKVVADAKEVLD